MDPRVDRIRRAARRLVAVDEREARSIAQLLAALDALPAPFTEAEPTHVTASAIVVGPRGTVLHRHKRLDRWLQPGGHIDDGEAPEDAALREVAEETGLRPADPEASPPLVHVDVHPGPRGHIHLDLRYLVAVADGEPAPAPGESPDVRWFSFAEAIALADPGLEAALVALRPAT